MGSKVRSTGLWMSLAAMSACAALGSGCASDCPQVKKDLGAAIEAESPFVAVGAARDELPIHFGIAVRDELLNEIVDSAMRVGLQKALSFTDSIALATGQKIGLTTEGTVADLGLYPDSACDHCLRVDGRLGGSLGIKLPVLGSQKVPLSGTFSIVAPVRFGQTDDGRAALQLDLSKATELAKSQVNPDVTQLPPTWWKVIEAPLSRAMAKAITRDLPTVTLFTFEGFDLGIDGLEVIPARIVSDHKRGVVFAGFTTNLAADGAALEPRTDLGKNDDLTIGIDRRLLGAMTTAMLKSGKLSRTWTKGGEVDPSGPISVTTPIVTLPERAEGAQPYEMSFRAWNVPSGGKCWWADTRASGSIATSDAGALTVTVDDMELTQTSLPGIFEAVAKWKTSALIAKTSEVVTKTLTPDTLDFAGHSVRLSKSRIHLQGDGVWLSGNVAVKSSAGDEPGDDEEEADEDDAAE